LDAKLQCFPLKGPEVNNLCVRQLPGDGLSFYDAVSLCAAGGGRLAHLGSYSPEHAFLVTFHTANIRLGLVTVTNGGTAFLQGNTGEFEVEFDI